MDLIARAPHLFLFKLKKNSCRNIVLFGIRYTCRMKLSRTITNTCITFITCRTHLVILISFGNFILSLPALMPPPHQSRSRRTSILSDSADCQYESDRSNSFSSPSLPSTTIRVTRTLSIPCQIRVARCQRLPEYGPAITFFSGGSAIRELSRVLKKYTHNSVHLISPFDSGGSSAEIRRAFDMLSVGDLRNRLMALADESALGSPDVTALFSYRLDKEHVDVAERELYELLAGRHRLASSVSVPMRNILLSHLRWFVSRMPQDFDLRGASVGNLIITGCFLEHDSDIVTAIYLIWTLLGAKGSVRPLTGSNLHIRTYYEDGTEEVGRLSQRNEL